MSEKEASDNEDKTAQVPDSVIRLFNESGNNFHSRVVNVLRERGWYVVVSPYYMDSSSKKPREIDIIAERAYPFHDRWRKLSGTVNVKLFIECKYISQEVVLWFDQKDKLRATDLVISNTNLTRNNMYTNRHHYLTETMDTVAKLFASGKGKSETQNEPIYKALNQSLNAMVSNRYQGSVLPRDPNRNYPQILRTVEYPLILCNSFENLYAASINNQEQIERITDNFQLEVNYAYIDNSGSEVMDYFLIDIANENTIAAFENLIESDVQLIQSMLQD